MRGGRQVTQTGSLGDLRRLDPSLTQCSFAIPHVRVPVNRRRVPRGEVPTLDYRSSSRNTSRFRNLNGPSLRLAKNSANSPVSGRLEFSIPTSYDENSTMSR